MPFVVCNYPTALMCKGTPAMSNSITKRHAPVNCICQLCNKVFVIRVSRLKEGSGKYCSRKCADLAKRKRAERTCQQCGSIFIVRPSERIDKYCSRICYEQSRRKKVKCICQNCGTSFTKHASGIDRGHGKYCSRKCYGIAKSGEKHPHWRGGHNNYRGENWNRQRKLAYKRDSGVCQYCGKRPKTDEHRCEVHHIKRFMDFNGDYVTANQLTNLITLCQHCHQQAEYGKIAIQPYLL